MIEILKVGSDCRINLAHVSRTYSVGGMCWITLLGGDADSGCDIKVSPEDYERINSALDQYEVVPPPERRRSA